MAELSFGEWLKRRRSALGLTQEQLARQIHCSTSALRKFESEQRRPSAEVVEELAEIFHIPPEQRKSFLRFARGDWQAISGGETDEEPWQVSRPVVRSNLPASTTSFIGREKEIAEISDLTRKKRLVTLTGAGGIGKTRLSIQTASTLSGDYPDGIWLVELAPLSDPALVPQTMVNTLGLIEQAGRSPLDILTGFLQKKRALLILDSCEHLIQACAGLAEKLLQSCSGLHILATSREVLGIPGEVLYSVPNLSIPNPQRVVVDTLSDYEAVQLFMERAQTAMPHFLITPENGLAVAQVCQRLDGIPLALELAAARVKVLRVEEIAARLDDRFRLLTGGARTALPRHQTLQAMIDWSHDLLTESERILLRRLSVFAGGWTLEAAESVCADLSPVPSPKRKGESAPPSLPGKGVGGLGPTVLDLLTSLVNKSLLLAERKQGQETRYQMLETIRQYANEKLWAAREGELIRQRHLSYFVDLAERAEPNLRAFDMTMWLDRLEAELDNIRVALEWAQESDIESGLRLASSLLWFWWSRNYHLEGMGWLEQALSIEVMERDSKPLLPARAMFRAKAGYAAGCLMVWPEQKLEQGTRLLKESLGLFQELGSAGRREMAYTLCVLGWVAYLEGDSDRAKSLLEESRVLFHELGDKFGIAECLMNLGELARSQGDFSQARTLCEERLAISKERGDKDGVAMSLGQLASLAAQQGDYPRAINLRGESLALYRELGDKVGIAYQLEHMAYVIRARSQELQAVRLLGAANALRESINSLITAADESVEYDSAVAAARAALGEEAFAAAYEEGKKMPLDEAIKYALEENDD